MNSLKHASEVKQRFGRAGTTGGLEEHFARRGWWNGESNGSRRFSSGICWLLAELTRLCCRRDDGV